MRLASHIIFHLAVVQSPAYTPPPGVPLAGLPPFHLYLLPWNCCWCCCLSPPCCCCGGYVPLWPSSTSCPSLRSSVAAAILRSLQPCVRSSTAVCCCTVAGASSSASSSSFFFFHGSNVGTRADFSKYSVPFSFRDDSIFELGLRAWGQFRKTWSPA